MTGERNPLEGEELYELLLDADEAERARAARNPLVRTELEREQAFLARCRELLLQDDQQAAGARLAQRLLARTTRQDPGLRGDLELVGRFLRERFAASPTLRVAAAIVLVQVFALPVLAWMVWRAPRPDTSFRTAIEPRLEPFLPAVPEEPIEELVFAPEPELGLPATGAGFARAPRPPRFSAERAARAGAAALRASSLPPLEAPAGPLALLLDARRLAQGSSPSAAPAPGLPVEPPDALGRALWLELALDRLALEGAAPEGLQQALSRVGTTEGPEAVLTLEALALERARSYGLIDQAAWTRLDGRVQPGARPPAAPMDAAWRSALSQALATVDEGRELLLDRRLSEWLDRSPAER